MLIKKLLSSASLGAYKRTIGKPKCGFIKRDINMITRSTRTAFLLVLIVSTLFFAVFYNVRSPDLLANWMGGHFYQIGAWDQVYPADPVTYSMLPPDGWMPYLQEQGYDGSVFPFIYPPLWAHVFGWLTTVTTYSTLSNVARAINPLLMGGMVILAWRSLGSTMSVALYTFIGLAILVSTYIGFVPIYQNQPQIFVSFLIVLAIERSRNAPLAAGMAMALAASIKLYPALFALFWLASGNRKAFGSFLVSGLALAGASVGLAGWPLHLAFLREVSVINNTALVTSMNVSIDGVIAQLFYPDDLEFIQSAGNLPVQGKFLGWYVLEKSALWSGVSTVAMVLTIFSMSQLFRKYPVGTPQHDLAWPLAILIVALLNPISWSYHYLPAVAFAPALLNYYRPGFAVFLLALLFSPLLMIKPVSLPNLGWIKNPDQIASTIGIIGLAVAFAFAMRRKPRNSSTADSI